MRLAPPFVMAMVHGRLRGLSCFDLPSVPPHWDVKKAPRYFPWVPRYEICGLGFGCDVGGGFVDVYLSLEAVAYAFYGDGFAVMHDPIHNRGSQV